MPIEVEIPGKGVAEFPEGTDELAILHAIRASFPDLDMPAPASERAVVSAPGAPTSSALRGEPAQGVMAGQLPAQAERAQVIPEMTAAEVEQQGFAPRIDLGRSQPEGTVRRAAENLIKGVPEFLSSPFGLLTPAIQATPAGPAMDLLLGAGMVKSGAQKLGEASVTGNRQTAAEGVGETVLGSVAGLHPAIGARVPVDVEKVQPMAAETFKRVVEEKPAAPVEAAAQPKEPSALSQQVTAEAFRPLLRSGEGGTPEGGVPEDAGQQAAGVRGDINEGAAAAGAPQEAVAPQHAISDVWRNNTGRYLESGYDKASLSDTTMVNISDIDPSQEHGSTRPALVKAFREGKPMTPVVLERDSDGSIRIVDGSYRINSAEEAGVEQVPAKFVQYEDGVTATEARERDLEAFERKTLPPQPRAGEEVSAGAETAPPTDISNAAYQREQDAIDAIETRLEKEGVDPVALVNPNTPSGKYLIAEGAKAMPPELADAYARRDAIDKAQVKSMTQRAQAQVGDSSIYAPKAVSNAIAKTLEEARARSVSIYGAKEKLSPADQRELLGTFYYELNREVKNPARNSLPPDLKTLGSAEEVAKNWPHSAYGVNPAGHIAEAKRLFREAFATEKHVETPAPRQLATPPPPESDVTRAGGTGGHAEETRNEPTVANTGVSEETLRTAPLTTPSPPDARPLGIVSPSSIGALGALREALTPLADLAQDVRAGWRGFAQETLPRFTGADREVGEAGARYAAAPLVGKAMGERFAEEALGEKARDAAFDRKLGVALKEDNLRSIRKGFQDRAEQARTKAEATPNSAEALREDAELYDKAAQAVSTFIGARNSPFAEEAEYHAFLDSSAAQAAIARHKQLWAEQKEPMFREAAAIDPETELAGRGLETGARINLTFAREGEGDTVKPRTVGGADVRQLGTLLRRDPFARQATGTGTSYHASYRETMADAFAREYPVAAQREFVRKAIESGVADVGKEFKAPEGMRSYPLKLNPWRGENLYLPRKLAPEYEALTGLRPGWRIPVLTRAAEFATRQSIQGLGEGTAHSANLLLKLFTGVGPTSRPFLNALLKAVGRADLLYSVPRAILRGLRSDSEGMLELAKINAAKSPYQGAIAARLLNPLDKGVRLVSRDVYKGMAEAGIVPDTETGLREFVNEVGNYTQSTQSTLVRNLRSSQVQPFATGFRTAKVQAAKRLALAPGAEATSPLNALALRADVLGSFVGTAVLIGTLNYLLNGNPRGLKGTRLGSISWHDEKGRTHEYDLGGLLGATSGARALGLMGTVEAKERGLDTSTALKQGARAVGTTLTSQVAGPGVRAATVLLSGKDPYGTQVADVTPPNDELMRSQMAKNIEAAAQGLNPLVDIAASVHQGKSWEDIRQRQLTRYSARVTPSLAASDKFAEVVTKANLKEYADWVAARARKLPMEERGKFVRDRLAADKVTGPSFREVVTEVKRKGVYRYE